MEMRRASVVRRSVVERVHRIAERGDFGVEVNAAEAVLDF